MPAGESAKLLPAGRVFTRFHTASVLNSASISVFQSSIFVVFKVLLRLAYACRCFHRSVDTILLELLEESQISTVEQSYIVYSVAHHYESVKSDIGIETCPFIRIKIGCS